MSSKVIVAIVAVVAAVLSLAAPVAVEAQTPTLTVGENLIGSRSIDYSGFTVGSTYYSGYCHGVSSSPATCDHSSSTFPLGVLTLNCNENFSWVIGAGETSGEFGGQFGIPTSGQITAPYVRWAAYSDSTCSTEVAAVTFTMTTSLPAWRVRGITDDSATIYVEGDFSTHRILGWDYMLTPGGICNGQGADYSLPLQDRRTPSTTLTGLSAGTIYTYDIHGGSEAGACYGQPVATVSFTTTGDPGGGPPLPTPDPPTEVETTTDGNGSVTISWSNPGDPDIASYEYLLRQGGQPAGEWRTVPGSNADTTSVTIDLTTGEAVAVNNVTPMVEWTIHLRARDVNGNAGGIFTTTVNAAADGTVVPAVPLAGLAMLALFLFLGGWRRRNG